MNISFKTIKRTPYSQLSYGFFPGDIDSFPSFEIHIHYGAECLVHINYFGPPDLNKTDVCNIVCHIEENLLNINSHMYKISYYIINSERMAHAKRILRQIERD